MNQDPRTAAPTSPTNMDHSPPGALLYADVPNAARRWERQPAAMFPALARLHARLGEAFAAHGGVPVPALGDAMAAVFPTLGGALAAALAAQRVAALAAPSASEVLPLRVAVVGGPITGERAGHVRLIHRAARLAEDGRAGEVLLADVAPETARVALPDGASVCDLGDRWMPERERAVRVLRLTAPDLRARFPPLATLDPRPHALPTPLSSLIDREDEMAAVADLVRPGGARLTTLVGPGGVGKTRLAQEVAWGLVDEFADGAWFVELAALAALRDPAFVRARVAGALGVREAGDRSLTATLADHLSGRRLLLVLDNTEQVGVAAAAVVAELLAACLGLTVLATSRRPLGVAGERLVPLGPLAVPDPRLGLPFEALRDSPAVRLFADRAEAAWAPFALTPANVEAVAAICRRLDGLPLAIELAAPHSRVLSPQGLLARLERGLPLPVRPYSDRPERQRTLRAVIAWSEELLSEDEPVVFRRLAVFAGGGGPEAVAAICGEPGDAADPAAAPVAAAEALAEASLVRREAGPGGEPRYVMLATIREYALERLAASGEARTVHAAHASHYLALTAQLDAELAGGLTETSRAMWRERLVAEHANVRAALAWALEQSDTERAHRAGRALWRFWSAPED